MKKFFRSRWGIISLGLVILVLIILLQLVGGLKPVENAASFTFKPVQLFFHEAANRIKNFFVYFNDIGELKKENQNLKGEINKLTTENFELNNQIVDSQIIAEELAYIREHNFQSVTAKVIGRSSNENLRVIIINKGAADGLQKNYPVIAESGFLVGKIISVNNQISKILLLNDNHSKISAVVQNNQSSTGIISGQYGITLKMELIPYDHQLGIDQIVTTAGLEQNVPSDLIIGKIIQISKKDGELFQDAVIEPSVNYQDLSIVSIILTSHE